MPVTSCDVCLGSDLRPHPASRRCGRRLVTCGECGLVADAEPALATRAPGRRDPRSDRYRAATVASLLPSGRVLDIGCGDGNLLEMLDPDRYEVAGVEPDPTAAAAACRRLRDGRRGRVVTGGLLPARLEAESFDLVLLFGALGRAASPRALVMETVRLLRGHGQVAIETPCRSSFTARLLGARWSPLSDPATLHIFDQASLERLVTTCGLVPTGFRTPLPTGWPRPGTILCLARKTSGTLKTPTLAAIASVAGMGKATPQGA